MPSFPRPHLRSLLPGLGHAVLLLGTYEAVRMGPTVAVSFVLVVMAALMVRWGRESNLALAGAGRAPEAGLPSNVLARVAKREDPTPSWNPPVSRRPSSSGKRGFWSWVKICVGSAGLLLCGPWWMLLIAMLFLPDPAPALDNLFLNYSLTLISVSVLVTLLFGVILRSGLRGPSDPFAPDQGPLGGLRPPFRPRGRRALPRRRHPHEKPYLRLVPPSP